jgi:hypothetical protein
MRWRGPLSAIIEAGEPLVSGSNDAFGSATIREGDGRFF